MKNICVVCNCEFEALKSTKKYCSKDCENTNRRIKYAQKKQEEKILGVEKQEKLMSEKECLLCHTLFRPKTKSANLRSCCYTCMPDGIQLTRGDFLAKIKYLRGGKCEKCGYDNCIKALEFHHLDPSKKDFTISNDHFRLKEAIEESKKCILICANCHRELHDNLWNIQDIIKYEKKEEVECS